MRMSCRRQKISFPPLPNPIQNIQKFFFISFPILFCRLSPKMGTCTPPNPVENVPFDGRIRWQTEGVQKALGPSRYRLPGNGE